MARKIEKVIIHCSDTFNSMDIGVKQIRSWHKARGWSDIGYHFIIRRDGIQEHGRPISIAGAHCKGQNSHSIGVCLVGGKSGNGDPADNFNPGQILSAKKLLKDLKSLFPEITFHGHNEFSEKECPVIDIKTIIPE